MREYEVEPRWDFLPPPPDNSIPTNPWQDCPGEGIHPVDNPPMLVPCDPPAPPAHTQVKPRCFTCQHFDVCKFKRDYLKTVTLIQNDLGDPAFSYKITENYVTIPGFDGFPLMNESEYFPAEVIFDNSDDEGKLFGAKFNGINFVNVVYKSKRYFILIELVYNDDSDLYELKSCKEAFYKVVYELNNESLEEIQLNLIQWREKIVKAKAPVDWMKPKFKDIINTTHFQASLECDMYEWNRVDFEESIRRLKKKYPYGIPIDENGRQMYHIATYHVVDGIVPFSPYYKGEPLPPSKKPFFPPPPPTPKKPPKRREDL